MSMGREGYPRKSRDGGVVLTTGCKQIMELVTRFVESAPATKPTHGGLTDPPIKQANFTVLTTIMRTSNPYVY